jgi:HAMP domain-containing protein
MAALSGGDMEAEIAAANDRDEIGEMARALQIFKESMVAGAWDLINGPLMRPIAQ